MAQAVMPEEWVPFWRPGASAYAGNVDLLFVGLLATAVAVLILLFVLLFTFAIRYRATNQTDRDHRIRKSWKW
jgi:cytochrome c oxidase subunit 2